MSKIFDIADQIAAVLAALPTLAGVTVIVDRQKDIHAEFLKATRKKHSLLTVGWSGADNPNSDARGPRLTSRYAAILATKPILNASDTPADEIIEAVCKALHGWNPDPESICYEDAAVDSVRLVPDPQYLIYQVNFSLVTQL